MTVAGLTNEQQANASTLLDRCKAHNAPTVCWVAIICAAFGESNLGADPSTYTPNSAGYWGVLQGGSGTKGSAPNFPNPHDTAGMGDSFLLGGRGFQGGGAIALARNGATDPGVIATTVEASGQPGSYYGKFASQASQIVAAFGGGQLAAGASTSASPTPSTSSAGILSQQHTSDLKYAAIWVAIIAAAGYFLWHGINRTGGGDNPHPGGGGMKKAAVRLAEVAPK